MEEQKEQTTDTAFNAGGEVPPKPEDCKLMWWDDGHSKGMWCYTDGKFTYCWMPKFSCWTTIEEVAEAELVRVASQNSKLRSLIKTMITALDHSTECLNNGDHPITWEKNKRLLAEAKEALL